MNHSEKLNSFKKVVDATRQHEVDRVVSQQQREIDRLKKRYQNLMSDYETLRAEFDFVSRFNPDLVNPMKIRKVKTSQKDETIGLAIGSDWHIFETVRPDEVSGMNVFNPDVAKIRIENFFEGIVRWTQIHRGGTKIDSLILALLGDLITNMLHADQRENNAGTPPEEALTLFDCLIGGIDYLIDKGGFKLITVPCVGGNHGRTTEKLQHTNRAKHSYEWLIYKLLERWYQDEERIQFQIATGIHFYLDVFDRVIRGHHGNDIKYQGGVGGLTIPVLKAIKEWNSARHADLDIFGHWHTMIDDSRFISNGSLIGYAPYSIAIKAQFQQPQQAYVTLNRKRWVTSFNRIYV